MRCRRRWPSWCTAGGRCPTTHPPATPPSCTHSRLAISLIIQICVPTVQPYQSAFPDFIPNLARCIAPTMHLSSCPSLAAAPAWADIGTAPFGPALLPLLGTHPSSLLRLLRLIVHCPCCACCALLPAARCGAPGDVADRGGVLAAGRAAADVRRAQGISRIPPGYLRASRISRRTHGELKPSTGQLLGLPGINQCTCSTVTRKPTPNVWVDLCRRRPRTPEEAAPAPQEGAHPLVARPAYYFSPLALI